nr:sulfatase-like hydrolase/transferase [Verrucomicrobium spinosum]
MTGSRLLTILVVCLPFLAGVTYGQSAATPKPAPPNVVLIVSDDHHWGDYGFMGHQVVQTPHLDRLAAESRVFARGYVPPVFAARAWPPSSPASIRTRTSSPATIHPWRRAGNGLASRIQPLWQAGSGSISTWISSPRCPACCNRRGT